MGDRAASSRKERKISEHHWRHARWKNTTRKRTNQSEQAPYWKPSPLPGRKTDSFIQQQRPCMPLSFGRHPNLPAFALVHASATFLSIGAAMII